ALDILERHKPELVPAVPAMLNVLNRELRKKPVDLSFIRACVSGASALDKNVREEFESHGPQYLVEGYGLSEASPVTHVNPIDERNRPGSIGLPVPDTDARIMDADSGFEELPIVSGGKLVMLGLLVLYVYY